MLQTQICSMDCFKSKKKREVSFYSALHCARSLICNTPCHSRIIPLVLTAQYVIACCLICFQDVFLFTPVQFVGMVSVLFTVVSGSSLLVFYSSLLFIVLCRTLRQVKQRSEDKRLDDNQVLVSLVRLFTELLRNDACNQSEQIRLLPASSRRDYYITHNAAVHNPEAAPGEIMLQTLGFCVEKKDSLLPGAGIGVFVTRGQVPKGVPVAMYPGITTLLNYTNETRKALPASSISLPGIGQLHFALPATS